MQSNIQTVLANTEKMENIDEKINELSQQAQVRPPLHRVAPSRFVLKIAVFRYSGIQASD